MNPKLKKLLLALGASLLGSTPAFAEQITMFDGFDVRAGRAGLTSDKIELRSSGGTGKATIKFADSVNSNRTFTWPDAGANASPVMTAGAQSLAGVKTFTDAPVFPAGTSFASSPTITGGLTSANIQSGSAKRQVIRVQLSPITGAAADSTTYAGLASFGRACTVTRISFVCTVAPTIGTDTIEVLKNNTTTMLNAATYDANSLTALTVATATLTGTPANLALTATDVIRCNRM